MKRRSYATAALLAAAACSGDAASGGERANVYTVSRGDLPITVTETAEIRPHQSIRIKNEMEGQATIISLISEGAVVVAGDKLVELDASALIERRAQQAIAVHRAEAQKIEAEKELEIRRNELEAERLGGLNKVRVADLDLKKFEGEQRADGARVMGEREQEIIEARANIELAQQEVKLAQNKLSWSDKLFAKGFITKDELERDQIDHQRQQKNLIVARNQLEILEQYAHPKERITLEQAVAEAKTELDSILARGEARLAQASADLEANRKEYELALERHQNLEKQVASAVIRAPAPGLVVFAVEEGGMRGRQDVIEEGATVRERQTLIELPDVSRMVATLKVHESLIYQVRPGQRARIKVDAFQEREFTGTVRRVSPVADSGSRWSNSSLKVYKTDVDIDGDNQVLTPGMSASVTILVAQLEHVLFVPLTAIRRQGAVTFVWLDAAARPLARQVDVGLHDFQFVEITGGLAEGDRVFLATPAGAVEPEFVQPSAVIAASVRADDRRASVPATSDASESPAEPRDGSDDGGECRRRRGPGRGEFKPGPAFAALQALLVRKYPDFAALAEGERRFELFRDEEFQRARAQDPELQQAWDSTIAEMRAASAAAPRGAEGPEVERQQDERANRNGSRR